jgi:hypothetical protein
MTDEQQNNLPPIAASPEIVAGMSPAGKAQAKALYLAQGYTPEQVSVFDAAPASVATTVVRQNSNDFLNEREIKGGLEALAKVNPSAAHAAAKEWGVPLDGAPPAGAATDRPDYSLNYGSHAKNMSTDELHQFDNQFNQAAGQLGMDGQFAQQMLGALLDSAASWDAVAEADIEPMKERLRQQIDALPNGKQLLADQAKGWEKLQAVAPEFAQSLAQRGAHLSPNSLIALARLGAQSGRTSSRPASSRAKETRTASEITGEWDRQLAALGKGE